MNKHRTGFGIVGGIMVCALLCSCRSGEAQVGVPGGDPDQPEVILWPDPDYPTLQSAVDGLMVGGVLQIAMGEHDVTEPIIIAKRLTIQGSGACDMAGNQSTPPDGEEIPSDEQTHLVGPPPDSVPEADDAVGLFTYVGPDAGGVLRRLNISGFDTGILSRDTEGATAADVGVNYGSLVVDQVCVENTGRGVTWLGSTALTMINSAILNTLWNAVTLAPRVVFPGALKAHTFWGMQIHQSESWCIYQKNGIIAAHLSWFVECQAGGIYVEDGGLSVDDSVFTNLGGPGIGVLRSGAYIENNSILGTEVAGILLHTAGPSNLVNNHIDQTASIQIDSTTNAFGDGIIAVSSPHVVVDNSTVANSSRAAISSFGSTVNVLNTTMRCQSFDLVGADFDGSMAVLNDIAGNTCGCPAQNIPMTQCMRAGSGADPPSPVGGLE